MNTPLRRASLIERASEFYGFEGELGAWGRPATEASFTRASPALDTDGDEEAGSIRAEELHKPPFVWDGIGRPLTPSPSALDQTGPRPHAIDRARLALMGAIVPGAPVGALAEEFRLIKRQLLLTARTMAGVKARTVLVGSAKPGDGKTYCAINLALSLAAERDTEVLLVDADFAKPDILAKLGLDAGPGLLDTLANPALDPESLVVRTDVPQLSLLPAGTKSVSDTELLASRRLDEVLETLLAADARRVIVFDTPPALGASPASVLALHVGQVMLVVRADRTTETDVRRAVALLDGCEHISLALNAVSFVPANDRFGSYYGQAGTGR